MKTLKFTEEMKEIENVTISKNWHMLNKKSCRIYGEEMVIWKHIVTLINY